MQLGQRPLPSVSGSLSVRGVPVVPRELTGTPLMYRVCCLPAEKVAAMCVHVLSGAFVPCRSCFALLKFQKVLVPRVGPSTFEKTVPSGLIHRPKLPLVGLPLPIMRDESPTRWDGFAQMETVKSLVSLRLLRLGSLTSHKPSNRVMVPGYVYTEMGGGGGTGGGVGLAFTDLRPHDGQHLIALEPGHKPVWTLALHMYVLTLMHSPLHLGGGGGDGRGGGGGGGGVSLLWAHSRVACINVHTHSFRCREGSWLTPPPLSATVARESGIGAAERTAMSASAATHLSAVLESMAVGGWRAEAGVRCCVQTGLFARVCELGGLAGWWFSVSLMVCGGCVVVAAMCQPSRFIGKPKHSLRRLSC